MGEIKTKAIVLSATDYGEQDRMLTLFSPEYGRIDVKARACRKAASPLLACVQPFVYGEYVLFRCKEKTNVSQCEVIETFFSLREDVERFAAAGFAALLCRGTVQEEEGNGPLFDLFYRACSYLAYGENTVKDTLIAFLAHFLAVSGIQPAITHCARCGKDLRKEKLIRFSPEMGGALCTACGMFHKSVSPLALEAIRRILLLPAEELERVRLQEPLAGEVYALLKEYALYCVPGAGKAAEMLEDLWRQTTSAGADIQ